MPAIYSPPAPWGGPYPQPVTDNYGNNWEAYGPNQLKKPTIAIPTADDCCLYTTEVTDVLVEGTDPTMPPDPSGVNKSAGDTFYVCHPNGTAMWVCDATGWVLAWYKVDAPCEEPVCVDGSVEICGKCFNPTVWSRGAGATNFDFHATSGTGNGVTVGSVVVPFMMPKCGGKPYVEANVGATVEDEGGGRKLFKWRVSVDGAPFFNLQTTGSSAVVETGVGSSVGGEIAVHSIIDNWPQDLAGGAHTAVFELYTVGGTILGDGDIYFQSADARVLADGLICCDAEGEG